MCHQTPGRRGEKEGKSEKALKEMMVENFLKMTMNIKS